jgi:hypothetical protein
MVAVVAPVLHVPPEFPLSVIELPLQIVVEPLAVITAAVGTPLTVIANVCDVLVPQEFEAVTLNVPLVALEAKLIVTEFEVPEMVAPVPL